MNRSRLLGILVAVSLLGAIGAGIGVVTLSGRLDEAERRAEQLDEESGAARAGAEVAAKDLEEAEARIERLVALRGSVRRLERQRERAAETVCFEEPGKFSGDVRGPIRGDVDGDSAADIVFAVGLPGPRDICSYYIVADLGFGEAMTAPVRTAPHITEANYDLRFHLMPAFFVELNTLPGHEVVVQTSRGATGGSYQLFTLVDGELQTLERAEEFGWSFGSSASAGGGTGLDCAGPSTIVVGHYGYSVDSEDHTVERRFYRVVGATLTLEDIETYNVPYGRENRFPELARGDGVPFPNCDDRIPPYRPPR